MGKGKLRGTILEDSVQEQDIHIAQEQSKRKRIQRTLLNPSTGKSKKASSITISKKHRKPSHEADGDDQVIDKAIKEAKKKKKEIDDQESEQDGDSDGDDDEDEGVKRKRTRTRTRTRTRRMTMRKRKRMRKRMRRLVQQQQKPRWRASARSKN